MICSVVECGRPVHTIWRGCALCEICWRWFTSLDPNRLVMELDPAIHEVKRFPKRHTQIRPRIGWQEIIKARRVREEVREMLEKDAGL